MLYVSVALGASVLEKGIYFDPQELDQDIAHSMGIDDLTRVLRAVNDSWVALGKAERDPQLKIDWVIGTSQRQCLVANRDLQAGDAITLETVRFAFPCKGVPVEHWDLVSSWRITAPVKSGQPIRWEHVGRQPYRRPAWPGLLPARPIYAPALRTSGAGDSVGARHRGPVFALANAGGSSATFRIDDEEPLFVKLVPPDRWRDLKEAELIARWLLVQGAPAIAARDMNPPQLPTGEFVVAYPFAAGRPPQPGDARALGLGLGSLHAALGISSPVRRLAGAYPSPHRRLVAIRAKIAAR